MGVFVGDYLGIKSLFLLKKLFFIYLNNFLKIIRILKKSIFKKLKIVAYEKNQFSTFLPIYKI